jgi:hypothetical protein
MRRKKGKERKKRTAGLTLLVVAFHRAGGSVELVRSEDVASPFFERKESRRGKVSLVFEVKRGADRRDSQHSPPYSTAAMLNPAAVAAVKHASVVQAGTDSALGRERTSRESA